MNHEATIGPGLFRHELELNMDFISEHEFRRV